jgi:hypothetical protein
MGKFSINYSSGGGSPVYYGTCVDCTNKVGPWLTRKIAEWAMTSHHKRCDSCYLTHRFSPPGKSPSLHG